jgi:nucleotide-binding universal stress UspA family protein
MAADALDDLEHAIPAAGRVPSLRAIEGERAVDVLVDFQSRRPDSLLCMATHARRPTGQLLWGSVPTEVARASASPMLVAGPETLDPSGLARPHEVLVCLDGSPAAERAVVPASSLAATIGLRVGVVQVVGPGDDVAAAEAACTRRARELFGDDVGPVEVVAAASPAEGLLAVADRHPDAFLALATHARRVGARFREGSVAVDVTERARRPVLVVGPACRAGEGEP